MKEIGRENERERVRERARTRRIEHKRDEIQSKNRDMRASAE